LARQQAEPDLNLIEQTRQGWRQVKLNPAFVLGEPIIIALVSAVMIQDHLDFLVGGQFCDHAVKEVAEVLAPLQFGGLPVNLRGGAFQGGKQIQGPVALVGVFHGPHRRPAIGFHVAGQALDGVEVGLFSSTPSSACQGGFRYSPTTSTALGANSESVLTHQVLRRWR
jgi:hypothetical protein